MIGSRGKSLWEGRGFQRPKSFLLQYIMTSALEFSFGSFFTDSLGSPFHFWRSLIIRNHIPLFHTEADFSTFQNIFHFISNLYQVNIKQMQIKWEKCSIIFFSFFFLFTQKLVNGKWIFLYITLLVLFLLTSK